MPHTIRTLLTICCASMLLVGCGGGSGGGDGDSDTRRVTVKDGAAATFKGPNAAFDVEIMAEAREGSIDDLKDFRLEDDDLEKTPWYVFHTIENRGDEELTSKDVFAVVVDVFDDTGSEPKQLMPLADFPPCELENVPDPFPAGGRVTSCRIFMLEKGTKVDELVVTETRFEGPSIEHVWKVD